ncbi:trypsin-7-like [Bicyclus anynana]|uniref:Trypsin-7-like n=1 Tax=Bicyclus anynana TaxID=110368 RepID=A0A6J1NA65_BICAN|nr:trypsin-7-like [Bicyclus anynana]
MWFWLSVCVLSAVGWADSEAISSQHSAAEGRKGVKLIDSRSSTGVEGTIEDQPYQVSFKIDNTYYCGGIIIGEKDIVAPAHCTYGVSPEQVVLRAGSTFRHNGLIIPIAEVVTHPDYNEPAFDKDVGYMITAEPIVFTKTIQPIALPPRSRALAGDVVIVGWGRRGEAVDAPSRVMKTLAHMYDSMKCQIAYPTLMTRNKACSSNFHLGGEELEDCQRETDGAAIQDGMVVALVTFTGVCGHESSPSLFADLAAPEIRDFLHDNLGV